jgi:4-amino-4-deoxy-L-arabinose transferase-like glycosyltransferase
VLLSISVSIRFVAALGLQSPWIAPDEMAYGLLGRAFWTTGHMRLLDGTSPFYGLYPILAGLPLAVFGAATGLTVLKAFQVLLVSSTVVIVYFWARRLAGSWWAFGAAAMTAALPAFAYSGLIMKEAAFLPAATLSLWLLFRALAEPSIGNQALALAGMVVAVAMRLQGIVLLPTLVVSVCLMAWFSRDARIFRRFVPTLALLGALTLLWTVFSFAEPGGFLGRFGNVTSDTPVTAHGLYALLRHGYAFAPLLSWTLRQAGDVFLLVIGVPLISALILALGAARGREREPDTRALLAVTLAYGTLLVIQAGAFASRFAGLLAERQTISIAPPLFVAFAVWLGRGMPRPQPTTWIVALVGATPAFFLPVRKVVTTFVVPDAFTTIPFFDLMQRTSAGTLQVVWLLAVAAAVVLTVLVPRRAAPALAALVVAALVTASAIAQSTIDTRAHSDRTDFFGTSSPQWIDHAAHGPVAYLDDDPLWNGAWHFAFWNEKLRAVVRLGGPAFGAVPVNQQVDGSLIVPGGLLRERLILTRRNVTLVGRRVKEISQGPDEPGLVLWRTPSSPTISTWTQGLRGNVLFSNPVTVTVYDCRGRLELRLLSKQGPATVTLSVNGLRSVTAAIPAGVLLRGWIPAPPDAGECVYNISPHGLVLSAGIAFKREPPTAGTGSNGAHPSATRFVRQAAIALHPQNIAYCVGGAFHVLPAGTQKDATPAIFVSGRGLTCDHPPAGYVHTGFASPELGVPAHTYPLYSPP